MLDKDITIERLGNPSALAKLPDNLQKMLKEGKTYSEVEDIAHHSRLLYFIS